MTLQNYTSLHGHTDMSNNKLLDCTSKVSHVFDRAHELGLNGVAITDHETLSSFVVAEKYLSKQQKSNPEDPVWQNMKFIRGNEIYLVRNDLDKDNFERGVDKFFHFILLAKDYTGYQQLAELSTRAWRRAYKHFQMRVPSYYRDLVEVVESNPGHLIGSSACLGGQLGQWWLQVKDGDLREEKAWELSEAWVLRMEEIFTKEHFYIELQPGINPEQVYVNRKLWELSERTGVPTILTTDHHYTRQEDRKIHKAFLTSKQGDREVDAFYEATYMMNVNELIERFGVSFPMDAKEKVSKMIENTNKINLMCENYSLLKPLEVPYIPTRFDVEELNLLDLTEVEQEVINLLPELERFIWSREKANNQFAARIVRFLQGFDERDSIPRYKYANKIERLNKELSVMWDSGQKLETPVHWSRYLLQVSDYIQIFWTEGDSIVAPARGSAGASYISYALGVIQVDPTRESAPLLAERFMNPERASVLDIDLDIESRKREQCIGALEKNYGEDRVVRVATFLTEKARSSILTAARALDIDVDTARYIASLCKAPRGIPLTLSQMYHGDAEIGLQPNKEFVTQMKQYPDLWEVASAIEGLVKGSGVHAGGIIISDHPIVETCGIMRTNSGELVTAYDLDDLEELSLIKIDALATMGLSKIRTTLDLLVEHGYVEAEPTLKETYEKVIGVYNLDRTTPEMWKMVHENEIIALFQMEKTSGVQGIALTKPTSVEDLATLNSVIRLAPPDRQSERPLEKYARYREDPYAWDNDMDQYGLKEEDKEFLHDLFDYSSGIAAQQEDLYNLMTSERIVGYGFGQADVLRKVVAKKIPEEFRNFEEEYWNDIQERGSDIQLAKYVWRELVVPQAGYSFR